MNILCVGRVWFSALYCHVVQRKPSILEENVPTSSGFKSKPSKKPAVAGGRLNMPFSVTLKMES
jgi:hypothetical protein